MPQLETLFAPGLRPVMGMRSAVDPSALPPGYFAQLTNLRFTDLTLRVRDGAFLMTSSTPQADASFRGAWSGRLNDVLYVVAAYRVGTETLIYRVTDPTLASGWTWTEITVGATRFAEDGFVNFAPVRDPSQWGAYDLLVCTNGTVDDPRIFNPDNLGSFYQIGGGVFTTKHVAINPPDTRRVTATPAPKEYVYVRNDSSFSSFTMSAMSSFKIENTSATIGRNTLKVTATTTAHGQTVEIPFTGSPVAYWGVDGVVTSKAGMDLSGSRQLILAMLDDISAPIWDAVQVEVYSVVSSSYLTIWLPDSGSIAEPLYSDVGDGIYLAAFSLDHLGGSISDLGNISKIKLSYVGDNPAATQTCEITNIMAGGRTQGGSSYAVSYAHLPSRSESPAAVATDSTSPLNWFGGATAVTSQFILSTGFYYQYLVAFPNASGVVDQALFYRADPGEIDYSFLGQNGYFSLPRAVPLGTLNLKRDSTGPEEKDPSQTAPDAYHLPIPKAASLLSANGRLYAGGVYGATGELWISEYGNPFRFRSVVRFFDQNDPDAISPVRNSFPGETVTALIALPGSYVGVSPVLCLTNRSVWRLEGTDATSLSHPTMIGPHGCPFPRSVTSYLDAVWFMDSERQVREIRGGLSQAPLTFNKVDDKLRRAQLAGSCMAANSQRLYVSYRSGVESLNVRALVFDLANEEWCEDELAAGDMAGLLASDDGDQRRILAFAEVGHVYELERADQTTDAGEGIEVSIVTREMHSGMWEPNSWGRVGIVTDCSTGSLSTSRIVRSKPTTVDGTINLSTSAPLVWRYDRGVGDASRTLSGDGVSCKLSLNGVMAGGKSILALVVEQKPLSGGGADVA